LPPFFFSEGAGGGGERRKYRGGDGGGLIVGKGRAFAATNPAWGEISPEESFQRCLFTAPKDLRKAREGNCVKARV